MLLPIDVEIPRLAPVLLSLPTSPSIRFVSS